MNGLPPSPFFNSGATDCPPDEAATSLRQEGAAVDLIAEIFVGARKLENDRRFVLDVDRFMADIEPMPLFLRRA